MYIMVISTCKKLQQGATHHLSHVLGSMMESLNSLVAGPKRCFTSGQVRPFRYLRNATS